MTYKTDLQTNNTNLQSILDAVNALPEAFAPAGTINITENGTYDVKSYASASVNIVASGGGTDMEDGLVTRTFTSYTNDRVTTIGGSAFYNYTKLQSVNFPACTTIRIDAFRNCTSLQSVNFPVCKNIGASAFNYCSFLQSVNFPACTTIETGAFHYCSSLQSINFPVCTTIGSSAFKNCPSLQSVSFPACTAIGSSAFYSCKSLQLVSFPACTTIHSSAFYSCPSLTTVSFPSCTSIGGYAFRDCYRLSNLTLGASTVCTLANSNAFTSTPYAGYSAYFSGTPYIYVPSSLVASYKAATNWTYFSSVIKAIGGQTETGDGTISFYIDYIEYTADTGMTWAEWVESDYNTGNFNMYGSLITQDEDESMCVIYENGDIVFSSDEIASTYSYFLGAS